MKKRNKKNEVMVCPKCGEISTFTDTRISTFTTKIISPVQIWNDELEIGDGECETTNNDDETIKITCDKCDNEIHMDKIQIIKVEIKI